MSWCVECEGNPKHNMRQSEFYWVQHWQDDENPCPHCHKPLHWYGQWPPQKSDLGQAARPYEVLTVIRVNAEDSPTKQTRWNDEDYFPVLMVCQNRDNPTEYLLWPRYWRRPQKYGQEAPQLTINEWHYLLNKAIDFLRNKGFNWSAT